MNRLQNKTTKLALSSFIVFTCLAVSMWMAPRIFGRIDTVDGDSMAPTLLDGEKYVEIPAADKDLERGAIVIVKDGDGYWVVKRIIGLPGETVRIHKGIVLIDGYELHEPYIAESVNTFPWMERGDTIKAGQDEYVVMGDNREGSMDSRNYGPVPRKHIRGRLAILYQAPVIKNEMAAR